MHERYIIYIMYDLEDLKGENPFIQWGVLRVQRSLDFLSVNWTPDQKTYKKETSTSIHLIGKKIFVRKNKIMRKAIMSALHAKTWSRELFLLALDG